MSYLVIQNLQIKSQINSSTANPNKPDENQLEAARAVRHQDFDTRISSIADELGITPPYRTSSIVADELHPLVRNLSHNSISIRPGEAPDDLEVAE